MDFWKRCKSHGWMAGAGLGVLFLLAGAFLGQFQTIWQKAVLICLECIGIG